jgi:hypothetical protein
VPPYRDDALTSSSPAFKIVAIARVSAAWPEATASAPTPPSRAASRFSKTSLVGFMIRV